MKLRISRNFLAAALCSLMALISVQPAAAKDIRLGGDIKIEGDGDTVAIGGDITVDGETGDVAAIGGDIDITGNVNGDVGVIGGDVRINATVKGDAGVASGDFLLTRSGTIDKDLGVAAGKAIIEGHVKGDVGVAGGSVEISGRIDGNVKVRGGSVTVADGARIGGKLTVEGPNEPVIAPGASIGGETEYTYMPEGAFVWDEAIVHGGLVALLAIGVMSFLFMAPVALVIGLFLVFIMARFSERTVEAFNSQPVSSFITGIGVVVLLPLGIALLAVTIIGLPLAVVLAPLYPFWLLLGFVGGALGLSRLPFRDKVPSKGLQLLYLLLALLVIGFVAWIPFVGHILLFILFLMGTGALTLGLFRNGDGETATAAQPA